MEVNVENELKAIRQMIEKKTGCGSDTSGFYLLKRDSTINQTLFNIPFRHMVVGVLANPFESGIGQYSFKALDQSGADYGINEYESMISAMINISGGVIPTRNFLEGFPSGAYHEKGLREFGAIAPTSGGGFVLWLLLWVCKGDK